MTIIDLLIALTIPLLVLSVLTALASSTAVGWTLVCCGLIAIPMVVIAAITGWNFIDWRSIATGLACAPFFAAIVLYTSATITEESE